MPNRNFEDIFTVAAEEQKKKYADAEMNQTGPEEETQKSEEKTTKATMPKKGKAKKDSTVEAITYESPLRRYTFYLSEDLSRNIDLYKAMTNEKELNDRSAIITAALNEFFSKRGFSGVESFTFTN